MTMDPKYIVVRLPRSADPGSEIILVILRVSSVRRHCFRSVRSGWKGLLKKQDLAVRSVYMLFGSCNVQGRLVACGVGRTQYADRTLVVAAEIRTVL